MSFQLCLQPVIPKLRRSHCYGYCGYEYQGLENTCSVCQELDLRYFYDELMISVSTYNAGSTMTVEYTADLIYPAKKIIMEELDVIKEMYRTMCEPYANAPVGWTWEDHRVVESDARGEKDSRNKPYCDWFVRPFPVTSAFERLTQVAGSDLRNN